MKWKLLSVLSPFPQKPEKQKKQQKNKKQFPNWILRVLGWGNYENKTKNILGSRFQQHFAAHNTKARDRFEFSELHLNSQLVLVFCWEFLSFFVLLQPHCVFVCFFCYIFVVVWQLKKKKKTWVDFVGNEYLFWSDFWYSNKNACCWSTSLSEIFVTWFSLHSIVCVETDIMSLSCFFSQFFVLFFFVLLVVCFFFVLLSKTNHQTKTKTFYFFNKTKSNNPTNQNCSQKKNKIKTTKKTPKDLPKWTTIANKEKFVVCFAELKYFLRIQRHWKSHVIARLSSISKSFQMKTKNLSIFWGVFLFVFWFLGCWKGGSKNVIGWKIRSWWSSIAEFFSSSTSRFVEIKQKEKKTTKNNLFKQQQKTTYSNTNKEQLIQTTTKNNVFKQQQRTTYSNNDKEQRIQTTTKQQKWLFRKSRVFWHSRPHLFCFLFFFFGALYDFEKTWGYSCQNIVDHKNCFQNTAISLCIKLWKSLHKCEIISTSRRVVHPTSKKERNSNIA